MTGESLLIRHARVITPGQTLDDGFVRIENGKILEVGTGQPPAADKGAVNIVDAEGRWLVPGFIDIHVHGANGAEVTDGTTTAIQTIGQFHAEHGTTGWLPTTMTVGVESLERSILAVNEVKNDPRASGAAVLGLHLEGPFISPAKIGAQNPGFVLSPTIDVMAHLAGLAPGLIRKVTLAPERDGALELIRWLTDQEIISSIGHTDGSYEDTMKAVQAGASHATHLFNAMRGLHHRDGGVVGACLLSDKVTCELIADGHHVDTEVMKLVVRIKGKERIVLITDAIAATGKPNGCYQLGGLDIIVQDGKSVLAQGGALAGSTLTMDAAVRNMVTRVGVSLQDAVTMASAVPARELGYTGQKGSIAAGFDADLVLLDEALSVTRTMVQGREVFWRS